MRPVAPDTATLLMRSKELMLEFSTELAVVPFCADAVAFKMKALVYMLAVDDVSIPCKTRNKTMTDFSKDWNPNFLTRFE